MNGGARSARARDAARTLYLVWLRRRQSRERDGGAGDYRSERERDEEERRKFMSAAKMKRVSQLLEFL